MNRTSTRASGDRIANGISRAVIDTINDAPFMQTIGAKIVGSEASSDIEHFHPFGFTAFPMGKTTDEQAKAGMLKGAAEVLIHGLMGNRSHPVAMPAADRRFRPNDLAAGDSVLHDAFKQVLHMSKDLMLQESPKKVIHRVAVEKASTGASGSSGSSGSSDGQQQKNNGANLKAEKDVKASAEMDVDGNYTITATKSVTLQIGSSKIVMTAQGITVTGPKIDFNKA